MELPVLVLLLVETDELETDERLDSLCELLVLEELLDDPELLELLDTLLEEIEDADESELSSSTDRIVISDDLWVRLSLVLNFQIVCSPSVPSRLSVSRASHIRLSAMLA